VTSGTALQKTSGGDFERGLQRQDQRRVLALLPGEPAGRISTRSAGAVSLRVALTVPPGTETSSEPILCAPVPGARYYSLAGGYDPASATRRISCEIRALHNEQLTAALDAALRSVTAYAALTEAVLETQAVRLADPSVTSPALVEEVARQLSGYGLRLSFGPSWTPAPWAAASIGARGLEEALEGIFRVHPALRPERRTDTRQ
jgi:hypothetical protein